MVDIINSDVLEGGQVIVENTASAVASVDYLGILYAFLPLIICVVLFLMNEAEISLKLFSKRRIAIIYDKAGEEVHREKIDITKKYFTYDDGKYIISADKSSHFIKKQLFRETYYYFYNLDNPKPLIFGQGIKTDITAEDFNNIFETKLIKDLNDLSKDGLSKFLTAKNIVIIAVVIGLVYYFSKGM